MTTPSAYAARQRPALIAEDLLLLLTDDRTGKLVAPSNQVDVALGGAVLIELVGGRRLRRRVIGRRRTVEADLGAGSRGG